jgi:hypothetical protein
MENWDAWQRRLGVCELRTPVAVHPSPIPGDLRSFAGKKEREAELLAAVPGFSPLPGAQLMLDFCRNRLVKRLPKQARTVLKDSAVSVMPQRASKAATHNGDSATDLEGGEVGTVLEVRLASGRTLTARAVVAAGAPLLPVRPAWARPLLLDSKTIGSPPNPSIDILTWNEVDLSDSRCQLAGKSVSVVGGGMTAAMLALGAAAKGAKVTLICRRYVAEAADCCFL